MKLEKLNLTDYVDQYNEKRSYKKPPMPTQVSSVIDQALKGRIAKYKRRNAALSQSVQPPVSAPTLGLGGS